jgi:hypothetical protein
MIIQVTKSGVILSVVKSGSSIDVAHVGVQGAAGIGVPAGGTTGQVLAKNSNTDYDTELVNQSGGGGGGVTDHGDLTGLADDDHLQYHTDSRADARYYTKTELDSATGKVDKVTGKQLSTEDYSTAEKSKLAGIAAGATANSSDATLLNRANHTGTQAPSTIATNATNRFTTDAEKTSWNAKVDRAGDTMTGSLQINGNNGLEFGGVKVTNSNLTGYCTLTARADDGEVVQIGALNSDGAINAFGIWVANTFGLYAKRTLNIMTDSAGAEIRFATDAGGAEVAKIDSTGKFSSKGIALTSGTVENVPTPTVGTHASNKSYVDTTSIVNALIFG